MAKKSKGNDVTIELTGVKATAKVGSFEAFVQLANKAFAEQSRSGVKEDFHLRRDWWIQEIGKLYSQIDVWLKPLVKSGAISMEERDVGISEQQIGMYVVKVKSINVAGSIVELVPKATLILGGLGRIDLMGVRGQQERIILDSDDGNDVPLKDRKTQWKVAVRGQATVDLAPLDKDNFSLILSGLANLPNSA